MRDAEQDGFNVTKSYEMFGGKIVAMSAMLLKDEQTQNRHDVVTHAGRSEEEQKRTGWKTVPC